MTRRRAPRSRIFKSEVATNRAAVVKVKDYHVSLQRLLLRYLTQQQYQDLEQSMWSTVYSPTSFTENFVGLLTSTTIFLEDVVQTEPRLVKNYDALLPRITAALEE